MRVYYTVVVVVPCGDSGRRLSSVYAPLAAFLRAAPVDEVTVTFGELERILGRPLPRSARADGSWWANQAAGRQQARAWLEAGWHVRHCWRASETVAFERMRAAPSS